MKKNKKIILILAILVVAIAVVVTIVLNTTNNSNNIIIDSNNNLKVELDDTFGKNIYSVKNINNLDVYSSEFRAAVDEVYQNLQNGKYTFRKPLIVYNLYGTNKLSFNLKFLTREESYLRYTITVDDYKIKDYTNTLKNDGENNFTNNHEYQIIGFVPGYENILKLELVNASNKVIASKKIQIDLSNISICSEIILKRKEGKSSKTLANGLYAAVGNDSEKEDYFSLYDNNGIIRSEVPITSYRSHGLVFRDNIMYYSNSEKQIVALNNLGRVVECYDLGTYELHHDYVFDKEGNLLVLATNTQKDTVEDSLIKVNLDTKEVIEVIDFETLFQSFADISTLPENEEKLDWFHANSLEYVNGDVIISSRETSSIIKFTDIENEPKIKYIIAADKLWKGTEFEKYLYKQVGDFKAHAGQHSVRYISTDIEGEYYLFFYNNNYGLQTTRPEFDYSSIGINNKKYNKGDKSYYYMYKVNENNKTFELVDSLAVVYSGIVSSTQIMSNGNLIINSGVPGVFAEYDEEHKLIKRFKITPNEKFVYRVLKYDFNDFWFNSN